MVEELLGEAHDQLGHRGAPKEQLRPQQGLLELAVPDGRANLAGRGLAKGGREEPRGVGVDRTVDAIEERARHNLGMIKPNETFYQLVEDQ